MLLVVGGDGDGLCLDIFVDFMLSFSMFIIYFLIKFQNQITELK